jgi:alcohol dehydrogenase class IV
MSPFGASRTPRNVVFGKGQRAALGLSAKALGSRAFICTDERLGGEASFRDMIDDLKANGLAVHVYDRTIAELPLTCLDECITSAKAFGPDVVIGIGGGSCMDLAKAAAVMLTHGGDIRSYYGEFKVPGPVLPLICIPTTSGTGSEVTPVAVLGDPERAMKVGIASPHIIAHTAICDPELTYSCPPALTAISGSDALTHAIEAFTAIQRPVTAQLAHEHVFIGKNLFSDRQALYAIELIARSLRRAFSKSDDEAARADLMLGALAAGLAFGTAGTAAAHAIQYPVGALTHTPHGTGVALLMPYVMDFNRPACIAEFASIALAMGAERGGRTDEVLAAEAVERVRSLFKDVRIPTTLVELSVPADRLDWVAENAFSAQRLIKNNPVSLDVAGLRQIIEAAYNGKHMSCAA